MSGGSKLKSLRKRGRFWIGIFLVLIVQFAFIFWLGDRQPIQPRPPQPAPELLVISSQYAEMLQVVDPTLFALPHEQGFSGPGWLIPPVQEIQPFAWSEPPRWLALPVAELGAAFSKSIGTNLFEPLPSPAALESELLFSGFSSPSPFSQRSTFHLEGNLANRRLVSPLQLPSRPYKELVSNTVVQVVVDAQGLPFSLSLLERSGDPEADDYALQEARKARFEPLRRGDPLLVNDLVWGTLIFEWHTVPPSSEGAPAVRLP